MDPVVKTLFSGSELWILCTCLSELKKIKIAWSGLNYTTATGILILSA